MMAKRMQELLEAPKLLIVLAQLLLDQAGHLELQLQLLATAAGANRLPAARRH